MNKVINFIKYHWLIISVSFVSCLSVAIAVPLALNSNKSPSYAEDGVIEIWTNWSPIDGSYNMFKETFVDEFNKEYQSENIRVELVTVSSEDETLAQTVSKKLSAGAKSPNIVLGNPSDSIMFIDKSNDASIYSLEEILVSSEYDYIKDSIQKIYSSNQDEYIIPYAPFLNSGEVLYINSQIMYEFLSDVINKKSTYHIEPGFMDSLLKSNGVAINIDNYDFKAVTNIDGNLQNIDLDGNNEITKEEMFGSYKNIFELGKIFLESYNGPNGKKDTSSIEINDQSSNLSFFDIDNPTNTTMYSIFSLVDDSWNDWLSSETNELNMLTDEKTKNAINEFYLNISNNADLLIADPVNPPTVPFVNNDLLMFVGANFNSKYLSDNTKENVQYDEFIMIPAPTKFGNTNGKYTFTYSKSLVPFKFNYDNASKENEYTAKFIKYVFDNIDYEYYSNTGYLPNLNSEISDEYIKYLENISSDSSIQTSKAESLANSLLITTTSIREVLASSDGSMFVEPVNKSIPYIEQVINNMYYEVVGKKINTNFYDEFVSKLEVLI
ncbi:MAG: hypothetical protein HRS57_02240 [Mycoplasmataceae bacterium]|nr:hypothetical protein [Mycoplasmataceae bacterium]